MVGEAAAFCRALKQNINNGDMIGNTGWNRLLIEGFHPTDKICEYKSGSERSRCKNANFPLLAFYLCKNLSPLILDCAAGRHVNFTIPE